MTLPWTLHAVLILGFISGFLICPRRRPLRITDHKFDPSLEFASMIIPARNEEANLPSLLNSIVFDGTFKFEVIVVDDHSNDRTAEIAKQLGARVVTPSALPVGWTGKTWACWNGAKTAQGDLFIFLDADTFFEKGGLETALKLHFSNGFRPMSLLPWHKTGSLIEQLSLFFNLMMALGVTGKNSLSGQSLFIKRSDYARVHGHECVKGEILENLFLASQLSGLGLNPLCLSGRGVISMRMYTSGFTNLTQGWTKSFAKGTKNVSLLRLAVSFIWFSGAITSFIELGLSIASHSSNLFIFIGAYISYALQVFWLSRNVGSFNFFTAFLYPVPLCYFQLVFAKSAILRKFGKSASWKGRDVSTSSS